MWTAPTPKSLRGKGDLDLIISRAQLSMVKTLLQFNLVPLFRMNRAKILNAYAWTNCLIKITGSPDSVRVPQYDASNEITVFGWGENTILKFVRNTEKELNKTYSCTLVWVHFKACVSNRESNPGPPAQSAIMQSSALPTKIGSREQ